jgi:hypothetical protein
MMRLLGRFVALAERAAAAGIGAERLAALPVYRRLARMGEDIVEAELARFPELESALEQAFAGLEPARVG